MCNGHQVCLFVAIGEGRPYFLGTVARFFEGEGVRIDEWLKGTLKGKAVGVFVVEGDEKALQKIAASRETFEADTGYELHDVPHAASRDLTEWAAGIKFSLLGEDMSGVVGRIGAFCRERRLLEPYSHGKRKRSALSQHKYRQEWSVHVPSGTDARAICVELAELAEELGQVFQARLIPPDEL